jgi:hypothetical protein
MTEDFIAALAEKKTGTIHEMEIPQCSLVHELGINI